MPYFWDSVHNTLAFDDRREIADDDAIDENGILRDGHKIRVPTYLRDSNSIEDGETVRLNKQELYDYQRAELSARWKGGLEDGDTVVLAGNSYVVSGRNSETGKVQLSDAGDLSAYELKTAAYLEADYNLTTAWMRDKILPSATAREGQSCTIDGRKGILQMKGGELVCTPIAESKPRTAPEKEQTESREDEWEMGGPLSDSDSVRNARAIKDACYEEYERELVSRWQRKE